MIDRRLLLAGCAALLTGCGSSPPPPAVLTLTMIGGADQNPNPEGHPVPVAVRLFELGATAKFERADVFALTEREQQTLGQDSLGSEELLLSPGETRTVTRELKKGTQFIGVAVLFRDIDHSRWRAVAPVAASGPSRLTLRVNGLNAVLAGT
jgi:type VI secretion system protein VasD